MFCISENCIGIHIIDHHGKTDPLPYNQCTVYE